MDILQKKCLACGQPSTTNQAQYKFYKYLSEKSLIYALCCVRKQCMRYATKHGWVFDCLVCFIS